MFAFKPLELDDRELFIKYLGDYPYHTYEYSFVTLYLWRKMCNVEFAVVDEALIIKKSNDHTGTYFMPPIGYQRESLRDLILKLDDMRKSCADFKCLFRDVEIPFLQEMKTLFCKNMHFHEDMNNFDYVYSCEQLITLSGHKYHRKKNQYNQFIGNYSYEIKDLKDTTVKKDCMEFARAWYESREDKDEQLKYELESMGDILDNAELLNVKGIAVYVDGHIAGFTVGEKVNRDLGIIHIEKGDMAYHGIYAFINKTFTEMYLGDVQFVNRQEDLGIEGLRKAKMAYHPVSLEKKFIVDLL